MGLFWMHVEKRTLSFPSLDFELQTVQLVGTYSTGFCCSIVVDIFAILGNFKTLKKLFLVVQMKTTPACHSHLQGI
jgi:hypothetical protein